MALIVKDSYTPGSSTDFNSLRWRHKSMSFTASSSYLLERIDLRLKKHATSLGFSYSVRLYQADVDGKPFGSSLELFGTFNEINLTTDYVDYTYDSGSYSVTSGNDYAIVVSGLLTSETSSTLYWATTTEDVYGNGAAAHIVGLSGWVVDPDEDRWFEVYADDGGGGGSPPTKAENPSPTDANASVTLDQATITWDDGGGADTFDVYYGTESGSLSLVSVAQAGESFTVTGITDGSPFSYLSVRYWRIDATNSDGTTTGDEWSFTTIRLTPPTPTRFYPTTGQYYRLLIQSDGSYGDVPGVGVENTDFVYLAAGYEANFVATNRRLVAAAENRIWYEDL